MRDQDQEPMQESPPEPAAATAEGTGVGEAWDDVLSRVGDLGDSISRWAKTAADDPANRRRLDEIRAGMDDMARQAQETFEGIDETEFGRKVREGAERTGRVVGDAAQKVSDAAAPHVAVIFAGLADAFGRAAAGVDESMRATSGPVEEPRTEAPGDDSVEEGPAEPEQTG